MAVNPMRILSLQPVVKGFRTNPRAGGKDKAALEICRALARSGHSIDLLAMPWGLEPAQEELLGQSFSVLLSDDGLSARALPTLSRPSPGDITRLVKHLLSIKGALRRPSEIFSRLLWASMTRKEQSLVRAVRETSYDLFINHQTGSDAPLVLRRHGVRRPLVLVHHSNGLSPFLELYDFVVFVSGTQEEAALARYPDLKGRTRVIRYFLDPAFSRSCNPRPVPELTFAAVLDNDNKGLDLLLRAFVEDRRLRHLHLNVIGEGRSRSKWEEYARDNSLPVRFLGKMSADGIAEVLSRTGAFVMPSKAESFGIVYLEALAMGVPIIGFAPSVTEITGLVGMDVGFGFRREADSLSDLADRILELTREGSGIDPVRRSMIAERVRETFSVEAFHRRWVSLVNQGLSSTAGSD